MSTRVDGTTRAAVPGERWLARLVHRLLMPQDPARMREGRRNRGGCVRDMRRLVDARSCEARERRGAAQLAWVTFLGLLALVGVGCGGTLSGEGEGRGATGAARLARGAEALAGEEARWTATGGMALGRLLHSATPLPSGRVLVVGGFNRTAELYDPAAGTWARTGDTQVSRRYHTLTALADGRVLLAGGEECQSGASAEVYEPTAGTWVATGAMVTCRASHAAVALPSGKVLVLGGTVGSGGALASAEVYDPATGTWTSTGAMGMARVEPSATLLPSGKVLVAGGANASGGLLASAEVYDPATGTWTATGAMGTARRYHTATVLASGGVLVAGGGGMDVAPSASAEVYDAATGTWTSTGAMGSPRRYHTATVLADGQVLVAGGYHELTGISFRAELYDPATGSWSATASLGMNRYGHTATRLADGRVLAVGGFTTMDPSSAELYVRTPPPPPPPVGTPPSGTSVLLQVVDGAGNPLSQAAVSARDSLYPTDGAGYLLLENLAPGRFLARVDALGFTSATVVLELAEGAHLGHQVKLLPQGQPIPFEAHAGGVIETPAVRVSIPAGAVVDALGRPVSGTVEVTVVPLDPTLRLSDMPGPLEGTVSVSGATVPLESFFMAEVSLWSGGSPAQLAPGASATLEFVLPEALASQFEVGDTVPAWWFDLDAGVWRQEGSGTIQLSASGQRVWVVTVKHFTWWNADKPITDKSCVDVLVQDGAGTPIPHLLLRADGLSYTGASEAMTGADGHACIDIKRGHRARISSGTPGKDGYAAVEVTGTAAAAACGRDTCQPVTLVSQSPVCVPGTYVACDYPKEHEGKLGEGLCRAAGKWCSGGGFGWTACVGEVLPVTESCGNSFDDDCDGRVNEDCTCEGVERVSCYTGPPGTEGVGQCHGGTSGCGLFGEVACVGQRLPRRENCLTPEDEDCDGVSTCPLSAQLFWTANDGSLACTGSGRVVGLGTDGAGATLMLGGLRGTLQFGDTSLTGGGDGEDHFVAKLDADGVPLWSVLLDRQGGSGEPLLAVDLAGNVLVAGTFSGTLNLGGLSLTSPGATSPFVAKLSPSGAPLWAQRFESEGGSVEVKGLSTDAFGNVALAGGFTGTLRIGTAVHTLTRAEGLYVARLDGSTGARLWSRDIQHDDWMRGVDARMDAAGDVVVVSSFYGASQPLELDGTVLTSGMNGPDILVVRLAGDTGATRWANKVGFDASPELYPRVRLDGMGQAWVVASSPVSGIGYMMGRVDARGTVLGNHRLPIAGDSMSLETFNVAVDDAGFLLFAATALGSTNLGGGEQFLGDFTAFVARYDANGRYVVDNLYPGALGASDGRTAVGSLEVDGSGNVLLGGTFAGTVDFGSGPIALGSCYWVPFALRFDPTP